MIDRAVLIRGEPLVEADVRRVVKASLHHFIDCGLVLLVVSLRFLVHHEQLGLGDFKDPSLCDRRDLADELPAGDHEEVRSRVDLDDP